MSSFPNFSNIAQYVVDTVNSRKGKSLTVSSLNCWARVVSGVDNGLILVSNPDDFLFRSAGQYSGNSLYGSPRSSGTIGQDWTGKAVNAQNDAQIGLPRPVISSFEVDEGSGNISRKATFAITAYTKAQLEEVTKYFLEPGFTVFLEWGWNTRLGVGALDKIDVNYVTKATSAVELKEARKNSKGHYECYLGFITGGSISFNGTSWEVSVNLTGFTELPAYLNVTDTIKREDENGNTIEERVGGQKFRTIIKEENLGKKRFKQMFNELPSIRRTVEIQTFLENTLISNPVNFVNFDEKVKKRINDESAGSFFWGKAETGGVKIPKGTNIVGDEKFIKFGVLMDIINKFGSVNGFKIGNKVVNIKINSKNTPISAFDAIFSTEKSKLIIPNAKTPKFDIAEAKSSGSVSANEEFTDCSFQFGGLTIQFPQRKDIKAGKVDRVDLFFSKDTDIVSLNKSAGEWGYLDDLYVNFDFAAGIIDTPKLSLIDALYQILNGMSSAVGGLWDFQVQEVASQTEKGIMELRIFDMNLVGTPASDDSDKLVVFDLYGPDSIFIDSSFNMDIGGAMMNQIIGKRLNTGNNTSNPNTVGKLFATGVTDKVLNSIQKERDGKVEVKDGTGVGGDAKEIKEEELKNLESYLSLVGVYPKVNIGTGQTLRGGASVVEGGIDKNVYFISYDDKKLFNEYKGIADSESSDGVSILLPITFSFTIHGVSGIKRGDKFSVNGLPDKYGSKNGFFQVLSVKHTVENMIWKTTVEGGFRQKR
jgi:hypothetical protein